MAVRPPPSIGLPVYNGGDLLAQSLETFGLVAIEAMAAGVAPVAPARGSFPELNTDGDPARYIALGERAVATCAERFSCKRNLEQLVEIYRFAIDRPQKGGAT